MHFHSEDRAENNTEMDANAGVNELLRSIRGDRLSILGLAPTIGSRWAPGSQEPLGAGLVCETQPCDA